MKLRRVKNLVPFENYLTASLTEVKYIRHDTINKIHHFKVNSTGNKFEISNSVIDSFKLFKENGQ